MTLEVEYTKHNGTTSRMYAKIDDGTARFGVIGHFIPHSDDAIKLTATEDELRYILNHFENLPISKYTQYRFMTWRGDFARFILDHIILYKVGE